MFQEQQNAVIPVNVNLWKSYNTITYSVLITSQEKIVYLLLFF